MPIVDAPLLPPRRRVPAIAVIATCAVVVAALGVRYANQSRAGGFDRAVDGWFLDHANDRTALWFADLGNTVVVVVCSLAAVAFAAWLRYPRGVLLAVLAPIVSTSLTEYVVKPLVHRTKDGYLAYPSGHTTGWCTVTFVVVLLALGPARERLSRRAAHGITAVALVLAVGCLLGLVGSDYHYATDVIGGLGVATASVLALALLIDQVATVKGDVPASARSS
jgi:membrane-associated phospholipid phosphatase